MPVGIFVMKFCEHCEQETLAEVFSCEFCKILKHSFFTEHLWTTGSLNLLIFCVVIFPLYQLFRIKKQSAPGYVTLAKKKKIKAHQNVTLYPVDLSLSLN